MEIKRVGTQPSGGVSSENFTGNARVDPLFAAPAPARVKAAIVTFEAGARTAWHKHPLGQMLIVTAGAGWVQCEGGPVEQIRSGDVVWIQPEERHWHGATDSTAMSHIAISENLEGKSVDWFEKVDQVESRWNQ